ncbi:MAG: DUF6443 domain-containing protein, partial [Chloroflexota bacterium]|nr:DUF6443 domain-containing protein [Chloroflexota bacterium]
MVHQPYTEFRGHGYVVETLPTTTLVNNVSTLNQVEHWFYQGDVSHCTIPSSLDGDPDGILGNQCFKDLRDQELRRGREYKTIVRAGGKTNPALSETQHAFSVNFITYTVAYHDDTLKGLWRAFTFENETKYIAWEGSNSTSVSKRTIYDYDTTTGNLLSASEYDASNALYRKTEHSYKTLIDANNYILDRKRKNAISNGSGTLLAQTIYGWDGSTGGPEALTKGELTLVRKYYTLPLAAPNNSTANSTDTKYAYDAFGNQTGVTTYLDGGVTTYTYSNNVLSVTYGMPGNCTTPCATARTTTTEYDTIYNALPKKITPPVAALAEQADYDFRMGLMTTITNANGQVTNATYDTFGRILTIRKPNDTTNLPTTSIEYTNYVSPTVPFSYKVFRREVTGNTAARSIIKFYDGLGREIQTKSESKDNEENIVVDKQYDAMGLVAREWMPRYVTNTVGDSAAFYGFVATNSSVVSTTTKYDALNRTIKVTPPDANSSTVEYSLGTNTRTSATQQQVVTVDARGNKKAHLSDVFGRLSQVKEFNSDASPYSYTNYDYSVLDLLTNVTDGNSKVTSVTYDSLGRKTSIQDPTMGTWSYLYHPNGQLKKQTDAKSQWIEFDYDSMDRLLRKRYSDTTKIEYTYDQARTGYFNVGQRTTMARHATTAAGGGAVSSANFNFDERGRQKFVEYNIPTLSATARSFTWSYDSADRVTSMVYPSTETVAYTYDAAWRQTSVCGQGHGQQCYATNASYTALDQPKILTYGNSLVQTNSYESLTQRMQSMQVGSGGSVFSRSYTYDVVGNVGQIVGSGSTQTFTYDHLDRLKDWSSTGAIAATEHYEYDLIGNLTKKGTTGSEVIYGYNSAATTNGGPYALLTLNSGTAFQYDANGNLTSSPATPFGDPTRTFNWNVENMPSSIVSGSVNESYTYDADGERASRTATQNGQTTTTFYFGGLYEEDVQNGTNSVQRALYTLNGEVVAQRQVGLDPVTPKSALLVVGNAGSLTTGETTIKNRLLTQGFVVSIRDDDSLDKRHAQGKSVVLVSSSVTPASVDTRLTYMEVPVLAWDAQLFDELGISPAGMTDVGFAASQTQVSISNASHAMAAGLSGTVTVSSSAGNMAWGKVNANAQKVATLTSDSTKAVIFGYEKGAAMHGLVARARRVGFFMSDNTASTLTANGLALFDAAVNWAIGTPTATTTACDVTWASAANVTVSGNTIKKTGGSDVQWDGVATSNGSFSSGDMYAQAVADRNDDTYVKFGLDTNTSPGQYSIDFAIYLAGGQLKVSENSNETASLGTYLAGDVFKVAVESGVVKYYKNGTLFRTSAVAPTYPLYFNAAIADPDMRVVDARFCTAAGAGPTASISTTNKTAMFVTGSLTLNAGETAIKNRLQTLGYIVNVRHYDYLVKEDINGKSLVLISSSVVPEAVDDRFIFAEVPVVLWEANLLDNMAMTSSTAGEFGFAASQTQVSISNASHAMAAGLSGTVTVSSSAGNMAWGKVNGNAAKVATLTSDSTKAVIFGYEKGAAMFNVLARARRVGFYFSDTTASALTTDGWTLFDAAVNWAVGAMGAPPPDTIASDGVTWANAVNVTASNNTVTKSGGVDFAWDGVATSNVSISSGNVYAQAVVDRSDDTYVKFGLDTGTAPGETTIDFAIYLAGGQLKVSENSNVTASLGTYVAGDVLKVAVESGV